MTAPSATTRITPSGRKLGKGGPCYITSASDPNIDIFEASLKPPGYKLDDRKDTTTSYNVRYRTFSPGRLLTGKDVVVQAGYDPDQQDDIWTLMGVRDTETVTLASGTKIAFYGWLDDLEFNDHKEEDDPMATLTYGQGNQDWTTCVEAGPTLVPTTGTSPSC